VYLLTINTLGVQMTRFFTMDTKALNHVLMNSYIYQKPDAARFNLSRLVGPGAHISLMLLHYTILFSL
jgi:hypothetical protein